MASYVGIPANNPAKYLGPNDSLVSIVVRNRQPTGADIRQGTTGQYYPTGSFWIISKDPTTGTQGELWYLSKIVANVAYWIQMNSGSVDITTIHTPDGTDVMAVAGVVNFLNGAGMTITGSGNNITFNSAGGGVEWNDVTGTTQELAAGQAYVANNGGQIGFSLPETAAFGDFYIIAGYGAGGWTLQQNAGQSVILGNQTTTVGVAGTLTSTLPSDSVQIVCVVADTVFKVLEWAGNITVV